ncbi:hypothetical protein [Herminiimonas fonticola]|uniref:Putative nucleic acid-binding protein n=1 Tax=Herminiimonas fonticola TaxID=303380 RepID=A0A4R6G5D0_9BURK|nr:hypothetical protein [Herminiimonas fonticola]RBA22910.1 hypothetical protein Hfont_2713 [Herminiimonas fonticola]TDN89647.1 putative nucleic acid-binding protein [Herminiimonas fonticola]
MVAFDAGILIKLLDPRTSEEDRDKISYLISVLQKDKVKIIIPTPAVSEFYVKADPGVLDAFKGKAAFLIASFDEKSAIECALSVSAAKRSGHKKAGQQEATWAKVKFDHQIVAIAKANQADTIYSEDRGLRSFATAQGLQTFSIADLPENPASAQKKLELVVVTGPLAQEARG